MNKTRFNSHPWNDLGKWQLTDSQREFIKQRLSGMHQKHPDFQKLHELLRKDKAFYSRVDKARIS